MKLDDLQKITPDFNWVEYFKASNLDPAVAVKRRSAQIHAGVPASTAANFSC